MKIYVNDEVVVPTITRTEKSKPPSWGRRMEQRDAGMLLEAYVSFDNQNFIDSACRHVRSLIEILSQSFFFFVRFT